MTQLNELRVLNDSTILYLQRINKEYNKNMIIKNILNDDACFFKMDKEDAISILKSLGIIEEELEKVYKELISQKEFYRLLQYKKIDINDENLIIKYPTFDANASFESLAKDEGQKANTTKNTVIIHPKISLFQKWINMFKKIFKK